MGKRKARRYEHAAPGDLVHVGIKKLGRIPDGGGYKVLGRAKGKRDRKRGMGYWYIHNAVDDHPRLAYSELLEDERKETAAGFWTRAHAFSNDAGVTVRRILTDNGSCYRSYAFADAPGGDIAHKRTRPYRLTRRPSTQPACAEQLAAISEHHRDVDQTFGLGYKSD